MNAATQIRSGSKNHSLNRPLAHSSRVSTTAGITHYPCLGDRLAQQPMVLVHGWGSDSQIWGSMPEQLRQWADVITLDLPGFGCSAALDDYSEASVLSWMHQVLTSELGQSNQCTLLGLSLGGMLCHAFALAYPELVAGLITISSNGQFVASKTYLPAMPESDFAGFLQSWRADSELCLKRFAGLQAQGDQHQRQLIRQLRAMDCEINLAAGEALLNLLGALRCENHDLSVPTLAIFGEHDALVPVDAARCTSKGLRETLVIEKAGHLPHLSAEPQVLQAIQTFLDTQRYSLDKPKVADSFGRAAQQYDGAATLQHRIGEQLLASISTARQVPTRIMDLGCGTGYHSIQLHHRYPEADVLGVDISPGMLAYAQNKYPQGGLSWLCGDAENLALDSGSQDLVFSNFALQWCDRLETLAAELNRVLAPAGQLVFAVPGPSTLVELREAWAEVDDAVHVNRFASLQQWQQALDGAGFSQIELKTMLVTEEHESVRELFLALKNMGAHNNNAGKVTHMTGKQQLKALYNAYEIYKLPNGQLPATWEIIFGVAF
ncbi:malonyl-ACP O-methyltransferase BioC [Porticoccaceae bacterium]|nr:malonyl-ACP O-methyltransferase BioC [Porticoccaceae bacterium]